MSPSGPEQRKERRIPTADSFLVVGSDEIPLRNWSYSGFFAGPYDGPIKVGDDMTLALRLKSELGNAEIKAKGKILRNDPVGLAGTWALETPDEAAKVILRYFLAYPDPLSQD